MEPHQNTSLQNDANSMHIDNDDSSRLQTDLQQHQQPSSSPIPNLPLFSTTLSDHTITNSSTLSSKSGSSINHTTSEASSNMSHVSIQAKQNNINSIRRKQQLAQDMHNRALSKKALQENDALVYLDGPQVYTCGNCRTHLTSHDDIISKSFHGRHGK